MDLKELDDEYLAQKAEDALAADQAKERIKERLIYARPIHDTEEPAYQGYASHPDQEPVERPTLLDTPPAPPSPPTSELDRQLTASVEDGLAASRFDRHTSAFQNMLLAQAKSLKADIEEYDRVIAEATEKRDNARIAYKGVMAGAEAMRT